jgi:ureidoglycolate dehydrogenase (NAD+)
MGTGGAVLPFGNPKGSAISFIIDIMCGVRTGAAYTLHLNTSENLNAEQNLGQVFSAGWTYFFPPRDEFNRRMDEIPRVLKATPPAPGVPRALAPGELELAVEWKNASLVFRYRSEFSFTYGLVLAQPLYFRRGDPFAGQTHA